jgi:hypothetical protein
VPIRIAASGFLIQSPRAVSRQRGARASLLVEAAERAA